MKKKRTYSKIPRIHYQTGTRNGTPVVLCNLAPEGISKVSSKVEDINCKHCNSRINRFQDTGYDGINNGN